MPQIKNYYTIARSTLLQHLPRGHLTAAAALSTALVIILGSNSPDDSANVSVQSKNIPGLEIQGTETPATPIAVPEVETIIQTIAAIPEQTKIKEQEPAAPQWKSVSRW
mgnify:CR=1 FL=1